jgi:hypothetical protein
VDHDAQRDYFTDCRDADSLENRELAVVTFRLPAVDRPVRTANDPGDAALIRAAIGRRGADRCVLQ